MRIYNDTNLIGENAEQEPDEYLALNQLRELTDSDGSKLIIETISNRTLNELEKTKDALQRRRLQKATDELLRKLTIIQFWVFRLYQIDTERRFLIL